MRSIKKLSASRFIIALIILISANFVNAENPLIRAAQRLSSEGYYLEACAQTSQGALAMLLIHIGKTQPYHHYRAYAMLDANGNIIYQPDSLCSSSLQFEPYSVDFDDEGRLFIYSTGGHGYRGNLFRIKYEPETRNSERKGHKDIKLGMVKCVKHVAQLGNILLLDRTNLKDPIHTLLIDNWKTNDMRAIDMKVTDPKLSLSYMAAIHEISDSSLLVIGCRKDMENVGDVIPLKIIKYIFDYKNEKMLSTETTTLSQILDNQYCQYLLPPLHKKINIKANGHFYYPLPIEHLSDERLAMNVFVELDSEGNFVPANKAAHLTFQESTLETTPQKYISMIKYNKGGGFEKLWIMSLDNFPTIVIDKGE